MSRTVITAVDIAKTFDNRTIFQNIYFNLSSPASLVITGINGSGKSTLSKIIAGVMSATKGSVDCWIDKKPVKVEEYRHNIGFVSPYLNLYDEFTASENLHSLSRIRATTKKNSERIDEILTSVGLLHRRNDPVYTFSSGMKQRLKYAFALLHQPVILILDEPTSNLDAEGIKFVRRVIEKQKEHGILIIATNDKKEIGWCEKKLQLVI